MKKFVRVVCWYTYIIALFLEVFLKDLLREVNMTKM
jgi:hypothetical protein